MEVGFTMSEAFANIKDSLRERSRKTNKVAEAKAANEESNGTAIYGQFGKEYGNRKF